MCIYVQPKYLQINNDFEGVYYVDLNNSPDKIIFCELTFP